MSIIKNILLLILGIISTSGWSQGTVDLKTIPPVLSLAPNEESSFYIYMDNPDAIPIDGVDLFIDFDSDAMEVLDITQEFMWTFTLNNAVDNVSGRVEFSGGTFTGQPTTSLNLIKVRMRVKSGATAGNYVFAFDLLAPRKVEVASMGLGVLDATSDLAVTILDECPVTRTVTNNPVIDGVFFAGNEMFIPNNTQIIGSLEANAATVTVPQSLQLGQNVLFTVSDDNCTTQ